MKARSSSLNYFGIAQPAVFCPRRLLVASDSAYHGRRMTAVTKSLSCTRRGVLGAGLTGAVALGLPALLAASSALGTEANASMGAAGAAGAVGAVGASGLITKPIPSSGQRLAVIGIGTNAFRDSEFAALRAVLQRMVQLGGALIDTAAAYGESEQVIGRIVAELGVRRQVFLATKLTDASTLQRSLDRLRTDYLDLLQVHNLEGVDALWPQLSSWKQAGRIRYIGMTTAFPEQHEQLVALMQRYPVDFIEVDYSIADRAAAMRVLPLAQARRIAVIADVPFGGRGAVNLAAVRDKPLPSFAADIGARDWPQLMLKYAVSHPAVTCAIPGSTRVDHLEDNQAAAHGVLPDAAMRTRIEQYWDHLA